MERPEPQPSRTQQSEFAIRPPSIAAHKRETEASLPDLRNNDRAWNVCLGIDVVVVLVGNAFSMRLGGDVLCCDGIRYYDYMTTTTILQSAR